MLPVPSKSDLFRKVNSNDFFEFRLCLVGGFFIIDTIIRMAIWNAWSSVILTDTMRTFCPFFLFPFLCFCFSLCCLYCIFLLNVFILPACTVLLCQCSPNTHVFKNTCQSAHFVSLCFPVQTIVLLFCLTPSSLPFLAFSVEWQHVTEILGFHALLPFSLHSFYHSCAVVVLFGYHQINLRLICGGMYIQMNAFTKNNNIEPPK